MAVKRTLLNEEQTARLKDAGFAYAWSTYPDGVPLAILAWLDRVEFAEGGASALASVLESERAERERMIYWLLRSHRALESIQGFGALADADIRARKEAHARIEAMLCELGCAIYSVRASKLLAAGEPGGKR